MLLVETDNAFEISIQQKKSWFLQSQQSLANRTLGAFILYGMLNEQTFFQATQSVVEQHEIFHTVFQRLPGLKFPRQVIADSTHFIWRVLPQNNTLQFKDALEQIWQEEEQVIFDLNQGPLLRMTLLEQTDTQHLLVINLSNLCADTKTMYLLLTTILHVYDGLSKTGCAPVLAEDVIQYADFTGWQSEMIDEVEICQPAQEKEDGVAPILFLEQTFGTKERRPLSQVPFVLNAQTLACCKDVARRYQTTENIVLLTCWYVLLHRLSGQTSIVQDYLDAGRSMDELQEAMGIFEINLPLSCALDGDVQVAALLVQLAGKLAQAQQEQDTHLHTLKEMLEHPTGKQPFSDIAFRYNILDLEETRDALTFSLCKEVSYTHPCKLMLSCTQAQGKLLGAIHYDSTRYELSFIQAMVHQLETLVEQVIEQQNISIVEQTAVTGPVPLTPIQLRFFERNLHNPHHWNQSVLLELPQHIPLPLLQQAVRHLVEHHDALRLRFSKEGKYWMQINAASEGNALVSLHDLSTIPAYELPSMIEQITAEIQESLYITKGPLLRFAYMFLGTGKNDRLFIAIHHLAVDGVSWRILLEDLETLVSQLLQGQEVKLPRKTASYRSWAGHLLQYAQSSEVQSELAYWKEQYRPADSQLPRDYASRPNTMDTTEQVVVKLSAEETQLLLHDVLPFHRAQMHEVLLAALLAAVTRWSGSSSLLVGMEGHGREGSVSNLDLTRTVGWFTSVFPLLLQAQPGASIGETLRTVKDQVKAIPNKGVGYGLLRYLNQDRASSALLAELPAAEIGFNYLGQFDQTIKQAQLMTPVEEPCGSDVSPSAERSYLLELDASILNNQLCFYWTYSQNVHQRSTIDMLTQTFFEELRQLLLNRVSSAQRMVASSDFPLAQLTQEQLDAILQQHGCVEDLYPVSLIQKGMLARYFQEPRYGQYLYQWSFDLASDLDAQLLIQAWMKVIDRHAALRTAFVHEQTDEPLLVIKQTVPFDILQFDWSDKSPADQQAHERAYLRTIQEWGFSLTQAPLLDLVLAHLGPGHSKLLATFSLLVVDVPSFELLVDEAFAYYYALSQNRFVVMPVHSSTSSYKEYIEWIQQQDQVAAREFWQTYLADAPGIIPLLRQPQPRPEERKAYYDRAEFLSPELTQALQAFAQRHQITLATILQGVWAVFLKEYTGWSDVIFGTIVPGRPAFLENVERRIGCFVNFLPVRLHVPDQGTFVSWIKGSQQKLCEMLQYGYISEEQIHRWCHYHPHHHLYQSLVAYETAPFEELASAPHRADVKALTIVQDPEVPLKLTGTLFDRLRITLAVLSDYAEAEEVEYMFQRVRALLEQVVQDPEHGLSFSS